MKKLIGNVLIALNYMSKIFKDKKPFLLAFDISTNTCGWAVFNKENQLLNSGTIEVNKNFPLLRRTSSLLKKNFQHFLKKMPG